MAVFLHTLYVFESLIDLIGAPTVLFAFDGVEAKGRNKSKQCAGLDVVAFVPLPRGLSDFRFLTMALANI